MQERPKLRLNFLTLLLAALCLVILGQVAYIQVFLHAQLSEDGTRVRSIEREVKPIRGRIWDRNGGLLVGNLVQYDVSADAGEITNPAKVAAALAPYLNADVRELAEKLSSNESWVRIGRRIPQEVADQIIALDLEYISVDPVWRRTYPEGTLAAHVLGFVNDDNRGIYGVEGYFDVELRGQAGKLSYQQDAWNQAIPLELPAEERSQNGVDLVLTLDRTVQGLVEVELVRALEDTGAKRGVIIVMDPRTGAILAIAALPGYDPNRYSEVLNTELFVSPAISGQYEPGSVLKVLTMAIALEAEVVTPETTFVDEGQIEVGGQIIRNAGGKSYGSVTLAEVLVYSLNVEAAKLSAMLGPEKFYQGLRAFGVSHLTGVDLEGEIIGELRVPGDWRWHESDLATNSFGQGLALTPLQMIAAVAAIANDGLLMRPYVVAEKQYPDNRVERAQPVSLNRAVSPGTADLVTEMMVETVDRFITRAQVPGYRIAGKSGTAQMPTPFGYDAEKTIASFIGFAPADEPQLIILVRLDEPTSSEWGSQTAAPTFARLAQQLFVLLEIPPDDIRLALTQTH